MSKLIYFIVGSGLLASLSVVAHDDFEVHDEVIPGADVQQVEVSGENSVDNDKVESYQRALEAAQKSGNPILIQQLVQQGSAGSNELAASPTVAPSGEDLGLPFSLLDPSLDRDQDGLSDSDEMIILTNPNVADTDGDGYADGVEVVRGYNPLVVSPDDKISYIEPVSSNDGLYMITGIRLGGSGDSEQLTVTGKGPNYSVVAILVFGSENKFWVTRTDKTGRFMYVSRDTLDSGNYKIYAASISAEGSPSNASKVLEFTRTQDALVKIEPSLPAIENNENKTETLPTATIVAVVAIGVVGLTVLAGVWLYLRRRIMMSRGPLR